MGIFKKARLKFNGMYRAKVLDNVDPQQYGRVRAEIYPMLHGLDSSVLPWAKPAFSLSCGASGVKGSFAVPDVGSFIFIFFENGDIYQPVYFAEAATAVDGLPAFRTTNYPNRRGFRTSSGVEVYIDDVARHMHISHPTGTYILIGTDGKVTVSSASGVELAVVGDVDVTAGGTINISGGVEVNINPV